VKVVPPFNTVVSVAAADDAAPASPTTTRVTFTMPGTVRASFPTQPNVTWGGVPGGAYKLSVANLVGILSAAEAAAAEAKPPPTPAEKLTTAIKAGDLLEMAALLKEDPKLLEHANENGVTPLFEAIGAKQPSAVALLAHLGANLQHNIRLGTNALFYALGTQDERTVKLLATTPKLAAAQHDPLWYTPAQMRKVLDTLAQGTPTPDDLDKAATQLVWQASDWFKSTYQLQKLLTHSESMKENPLGVEAVGWFREHFLLMRARNLLQIGHVTPAAERDVIAQELATTLEALRVERRMMKLYSTNDAAVRVLAAGHEVESILRRVEDKAFPLREYVIPSGWPKHAIYMSLEKRQVDGNDVLSLRIDNRGLGHTRHQVEGLRVHSYVVNVPANADGRKELKGFLTTVLASEPTGGEAPFYDALDVFAAKLIAIHGPAAFEPVRSTHEKMVRQMAGNCSMANFEPGVRRRLGAKAADDLKAAEFVDVRDRLFARLTPQALSEEVQENRERIAEEIQKSQQNQKR
jgi:hypothetical protein